MVKVYIERHLADRMYRDAQLDAGTHLLDPEVSEYTFPDEGAALNALDSIAADLGCTLDEVTDSNQHEVAGQSAADYTGPLLYEFNGPEEDECQGSAAVYRTGSAATGTVRS